METVSPGSPSKEKLTDREVAAAIASAFAQRKSKSEIVEELTRRGLPEVSASEWVNRAFPR
jgi:hypothetical protein